MREWKIKFIEGLKERLDEEAPGAESVEVFGSSLLGMDSYGSDLDLKIFHPEVNLPGDYERLEAVISSIPGFRWIEMVTPKRKGSEKYMVVSVDGGNVDIFVNPTHDTSAVWSNAMNRIPFGRFSGFSEGVRFMKDFARSNGCYGSLEMGLNGCGILNRCLEACEEAGWPADLTEAMMCSFARFRGCNVVDSNNPRRLFSVNANMAYACKRALGFPDNSNTWSRTTKVSVTVYGPGSKSFMASRFPFFLSLQRALVRPRCSCRMISSRPEAFVVDFYTERVKGTGGIQESFDAIEGIIRRCTAPFGNSTHWGLELKVVRKTISYPGERLACSWNTRGKRSKTMDRVSRNETTTSTTIWTTTGTFVCGDILEGYPAVEEDDDERNDAV